MENKKEQRVKIFRPCTFAKKIDSTNRSRRSILPPVSANETDVKCLLDIDKDYFNLVSGRKIRPNQSILKYKENIRLRTRNRIVYGFLKDEILRIDYRMTNELKEYERVVKNFENCENSFSRFLDDDYMKTRELTSKSDALEKQLNEVSVEHREMTRKVASLKCQIRYAEDKRCEFIKYQYFLKKLARPDLDKLYAESNELDENIRVDPDINIREMEAMLAADAKEVKEIYFDDPNVMLEMFKVLEAQNLNYLLIAENVKLDVEKALIARNKFKEAWNEEIESLEKMINNINKLIVSKEERIELLKTTFNGLIEHTLKFLIVSKDILALYNSIDYVYRNTIADNEINLTLKEMMKAIERKYEDLCFKLDCIEEEITKPVFKTAFKEDLEKMRKASDAKAILRNVERIRRVLKNSFRRNSVQ